MHAPITICVCNGIHKKSSNVGKNEATINLGTSVQIYNLKVRAPVLYIVALSELKLNENSEHDEVVMGKISAQPHTSLCIQLFV